MVRMPAGLRKARGDYMNPLYRRPAKAPAAVVASEEEISRRREDNARFEARMISEMEASRGLGRLVDREARAAVEGDTDLNHDNIEVSP